MNASYSEPVNLDSIETSLTASMICTNLNRLCILYLLKKSDNGCMQAEKIASTLGISHRTVLYHLDILKDYGIVEVREFRRKGPKLMRSVWGLNGENGRSVERVFGTIRKRFDVGQIEKMISIGCGEIGPRKN